MGNKLGKRLDCMKDIVIAAVKITTYLLPNTNNLYGKTTILQLLSLPQNFITTTDNTAAITIPTVTIDNNIW